jgi:hypothetical protein
MDKIHAVCVVDRGINNTISQTRSGNTYINTAIVGSLL